MPATSYKEFERRAIEAGVSAELAAAMYNIVRDAQEHDWMPPLKAWTGNEANLIAQALEEPAAMAEACLLLFSSDGLMDDEGQINAGISDTQREEIEAWIFAQVDRSAPVEPWRQSSRLRHFDSQA